MRNLIILVFLLALGLVLNFFALPWLLGSVFLGSFVSPGLQLPEFRQGVTNLFVAFWCCNVAALLLWFGWIMRRRAASAAKVAAMRDKWKFIAIMLLAAGLICSAVTIWIPSPEVAPQGIIILLLLLFVDEVLLFWLPTMRASPRSYRLVVPFAQLFQRN